MDVFEQVLADCQPGYLPQVKFILERLGTELGVQAFDEVDKSTFVPHATVLLASARSHPALKLEMIGNLMSLSWWCGLPLTGKAEGALSALARRTCFELVRNVGERPAAADPAARRHHAVFVGPLVNSLHSPTRGAFDYVRALASDPDNSHVTMFYDGVLSPELEAYAAERLARFARKVRLVGKEGNRGFVGEALAAGPSTFHFWCERPFKIHIPLLALLGPTVMFTCADSPPVHFSDVYWYCQDPEYMAALWRERGAPETFAANYVQTESAPFHGPAPVVGRNRSDLGFGSDETVIVTVGNRLAAELDQPFVDGMGALVLRNPQVRWNVVGDLPDYWVAAFETVLGAQFSYTPYDPDLAGRLASADIVANPFRAGGGNAAVMAVQAGAVVVTRGDMGDVRAFVPADHRARDSEAYFSALQDLVASPLLRVAWLEEQRALLARRLDQELFARELKSLVRLAYDRFAKRTPTEVEAVFAQPTGGAAQLEAS